MVSLRKRQARASSSLAPRRLELAYRLIPSTICSPRFSALQIVVLALGIAANVPLFAVADAVVFRRFPFADADRLVIAGENLIAPRSEIPYRQFVAWREQSSTFDDLSALGSANVIGRPKAGASVDGAPLDLNRVIAVRAATERSRAVASRVRPLVTPNSFGRPSV
jgi:hypothetical protein